MATGTYPVNTKVEWNWGPGKASGYVREVHRERVEKEIKGSKIVRNATDENPAYLIEQEDGTPLLKEHSELSKAS
jgi:hypothetical protein